MAIFKSKRQITVVSRETRKVVQRHFMSLWCRLNAHGTMLRQRQVKRCLGFGLLRTRISPLQMNINKELLISAACTVRGYVCMQGREQAFLLSCSSSTQPPLPSLLSSSSFWVLSYSFFGLSYRLFFLSCLSRTVMPHGMLLVIIVIQDLYP